jgi:replication factor A1
VIGVVHHVGEITEINTKAGKTAQKRDLTLVDRSSHQCQLTLWGKNAEQWSARDNPVAAFKSLKLSDFGGIFFLHCHIFGTAGNVSIVGRSLSALGGSTFNLNPDIADAHALRGWYDSEGSSATFTGQSSGGGAGARGPLVFRREEMKTIGEVKASGLGTNDKADYFTSRATIVNIKTENIAYPACKQCNKKVTDTGAGWRCESCDKSWDAPEYRYVH